MSIDYEEYLNPSSKPFSRMNSFEKKVFRKGQKGAKTKALNKKKSKKV